MKDYIDGWRQLNFHSLRDHTFTSFQTTTQVDKDLVVFLITTYPKTDYHWNTDLVRKNVKNLVKANLSMAKQWWLMTTLFWFIKRSYIHFIWNNYLSRQGHGCISNNYLSKDYHLNTEELTKISNNEKNHKSYCSYNNTN